MSFNNHLKRVKVLTQFSNGSASFFYFYSNKKEIVMELDIMSNPIWKNNNDKVLDFKENRSLRFLNKFFLKKN